MNAYRLDTNMLIALLWPSHAQHERVVTTLDERIAALTRSNSAERKALAIVS